jgi:TetR/AcrR family transcriptional repressor of nem operon
MSDTSRRLLAAAHGLVLERGYNAFSYADLAEAVGIRKASIHHHFPTKADLVTRLLQLYRTEARTMIAGPEADRLTPTQKLQAFVDYWASCIEPGTQSICLAALLSAELPSLPGPVAREVRGHFADLGGWLKSVFAQITADDATADDATAEEAAEDFMATVHGAMLSARAAGRPHLFGRIASHALARLIR